MFKISHVTRSSLGEAEDILKRIYAEHPDHWPNGLSAQHFDGGLYLVREKSSNHPVGFVGWQERSECIPLSGQSLKESGYTKEPRFDNIAKALGVKFNKVGYYSVGVLPEYRNNGFAKEALEKLISIKSAGVNTVRAMIVDTNEPSKQLAKSLGVGMQIKKADYYDDPSPAGRAAYGAGALASGVGAGAIAATGVGKAAPSFLDIGQKMFTGPSSDAIVAAIEAQHPGEGLKIFNYANKYPSVFKMMLTGVRVPGISPAAQSLARNYAFNIRPEHSQLGDVLSFGPKEELQGVRSRVYHALVGSPMHHTAIGAPESQNKWFFLAGRGQGVQNWEGDLSDMGHAAVVMRPKTGIDPERVTEGINKAYSKPYSPQVQHRLAAQELVSTPWSDRSKPTFLEKALGGLADVKWIRRRVPADIAKMMQANKILQGTHGKSFAPGHACSTAAAEALQTAKPTLMEGKSPMGVSPTDFLRRIGSDFDVVAQRLPSEMQSSRQLLANHLLKAGPMVARLALAAPLIAGSVYLGNKAISSNPVPSWLDQAKSTGGEWLDRAKTGLGFQ